MALLTSLFIHGLSLGLIVTNLFGTNSAHVVLGLIRLCSRQYFLHLQKWDTPNRTMHYYKSCIQAIEISSFMIPDTFSFKARVLLTLKLRLQYTQQ